MSEPRVAAPPQKADGKGYGRTVVDGRLVYTSVSAINRFLSCERSWYFRYVLGLPDPAGKKAQEGTEAHARLAHYLSTGEDVLGKAERRGLHLLPKPGPDLLVEHRVDGILDARGVPLVGGMDLLDPRPAVPVLTDHKFKGNPDDYNARQLALGYAKKGDWLVDPDHEDGRQMFGYAETWRRMLEDGLSTHASAHVDIRHIQYPTDRARPADELVRRVALTEVQAAWEKIENEVAEPMRQVAAAKSPDDVKANTGHCHKYHKVCVFASKCSAAGSGQGLISRWASAGKSKENNGMSFMDKLKTMSTPAAIALAPVAPPTPPQVDATPVVQNDEHIRRSTGIQIEDQSTVPDEVLKAQQATKAAETATRTFVVGATYKLSGGELGVLEAIAGDRGKFKVGRGPVARVKEPLLASVGEEVAPPLTAGAPVQTAPAPAPVRQAEPEQGAAPTSEELASPEAPAKRKRRTKAELEAARAAAASTAAGTEHVGATKDEDLVAEGLGRVRDELDSALAASPPPAGPTHLYFGGAYPVGVPTKTLHEYVERLNTAVLTARYSAAELDVRLSQNPELKFGQWKAVLAGFAKETPLEPGHYLVTGGDERVEVVAEALAGALPAGAVVRGGGR